MRIQVKNLKKFFLYLVSRNAKIEANTCSTTKRGLREMKNLPGTCAERLVEMRYRRKLNQKQLSKELED